MALTTSLPVAMKALLPIKPTGPHTPTAESPAEKLGTPFPNLYIGRDELIPTAPGGKAEVNILRRKTNQVLYSVESAGIVKRGLVMQKFDDHWMIDPGEANITVTQQLGETRKKYAAEHHMPISAFHSVSVPALNAYFVAVDAGSQALLIPVQTDTTLGVVEGKPQTVAELLAKLSAAAVVKKMARLG